MHSKQGESKIYFSAIHNNPNSCEQYAKGQGTLSLARPRESNHIMFLYHIAKSLDRIGHVYHRFKKYHI